jgi:hypothetical protein
MDQSPHQPPKFLPESTKAKSADDIDRNPDEIVTLTTYWNVSEADFARSMLESAGIRARISGDALATMNWGLMNATQGVKLLVFARDTEAAAIVLGLTEEEDADDSSSTAVGDEDQPRAASVGTPTRIGQVDNPNSVEADDPFETSEACSDADDYARRAFFSAVFTFAFFPMLFFAVYSIYYVVMLSKDPPSPRGWRHLYASIGLVLFYLFVVLAIIGSVSFNSVAAY